MSTEKRSTVGQSLYVHQQAVEHCEALYQSLEGEETDDVVRAEAERDIAGRDALEHLGRFVLWIESQGRAIADELERLDQVADGLDRRLAWATEHANSLIESLGQGRNKVTVGTLTIKRRTSRAVETGPDFDLASVPSAWRRPVPEVPAKPATEALDKVKARIGLETWPTGDDAPPKPTGIKVVTKTKIVVG